MTISPGHRCDATQALRQVLGRAVVWGMIDSNPAKQGIDNPQRRRTEKRPFESWAQLDELAARLGSRYGPPVLFAAATGWRSSSATSTAKHESSTSVARSETAGSRARRPRGASARCRCRRSRSARPARSPVRVSFSSVAPRRLLRPPQLPQPLLDTPPKSRRASCRRAASTISATRSQPSLRAGVSTFDLSRYMGASLAMIDRHTATSHATDASTQSGSSTATRTSKRPTSKLGRPMDAATAHRRRSRQRKQRLSRRKPKASDGLEPSTPSLPSTQATGRNPRQRFSLV
jgi:hypothetical protein